MNIDHNNLPQAVSILLDKVRELKRLFLESSKWNYELDPWLNLNELCEYLPDKPSKATV